MALGWDGLEWMPGSKAGWYGHFHSVPTALNAMSLMPSKVLPEYLFPLFPWQLTESTKEKGNVCLWGRLC